MDDRKEAIKKFLRDYAVAIIATIILICLLVLLILARYGALTSITDLSKINPLITSAQNELIAASDSSAIIEVPKSDGDEASAAKDSTTPSKTTKPSKSPTKGGGGGSSGGSNSPGSGGGSSGTTDPGPPFTAKIDDVTPSIVSNTSLLNSCTIIYEFQAVISGQNAPGNISYQWHQSDGIDTQTEYASFDADDSTITVTHRWTVSASNGKKFSITFDMLTPSVDQDTVDFKQKCSVLSL